MADTAKKSLVEPEMNLDCSLDCLLSSSVLQAKRLMEEFVKLKKAVAAAMGVLATLLIEALEKEKNAGEEEGQAPQEWMGDDVSSLERLNHLWMCLVVTENANLNSNGIWS